jgi:hypothetical protein
MQAFPLPGEFQYRVFKTINPSLNVWLDVHDDNEILAPLNDGTVLVKCTRVNSSVQTFSGVTSKASNAVSNAKVNPFLDDSTPSVSTSGSSEAQRYVPILHICEKFNFTLICHYLTLFPILFVFSTGPRTPEEAPRNCSNSTTSARPPPLH